MVHIQLRPGAEKRILMGHCWIFSNEVAEDLKGYEPGSWVQVFSSKGTLLGSGYVNPRSLIAVRLVCPPGQRPDRSFFIALLRRAAQYRERIYPGSRCHRLVYGEADGIPGLVVDRYEGTLVYQISTLGMARLEPLLQEILVEEFKPQALIYRHDIQVRELEGLEQTVGVVFGQVPPQLWVEIDGLRLCVDPLGGQKTGLYLDQRDNRKSLAKWVAGRRVLDLFCYDGGWSLLAAQSGAREVQGVDRSAGALQRARLNAQQNRFGDYCQFHQADVVPFLKNVPRQSFDVVIVDPPAFAKTRKALPEAQKGYIDLNRRALMTLSPGGLLVTCSCSHHVSDDLFQTLILRASQASGRRLRLLEARAQALDHPILLSMPETRYLKCLFLDVN